MGCTHVRTLEPPVPWHMVYSSVNKGRYKDKLQLLYIMITIIEFHLLVVTIYISGTLTLQL